MNFQTLLGYKIADLKREHLAEEFECILANGQSSHICCLNPHSYAVAKADYEFQIALRAADVVVADGAGVSAALSIQCKRKIERITGSDLFETFLHLSHQCNTRVFLLGSDLATLNKVSAKVSEEYPDVIIAGVMSPPFKEKFDRVDSDIINDAIRKASANVVFVSLSAPKQEKWVYENIAYHQNVSFLSIGAVFDFYAGNIKRSPKIFRSVGLEWLPRLVQEPRRLWKRTFISAPIFVFDFLRQYFLSKF